MRSPFKTWLLLVWAVLMPLQASADPFGVILSENRPNPASGSAVGTLAIDGTNQNSGTAQTVVNTLTTTSANDVIVLFTRSSPTGVNSSTVSSVSDTAGLTWVKRKAITYNSPTTVGLEEWYALSPSPLTADAITITMSANSSYANRVMVFGVSGANTTTPFDPNVALPASNGQFVTVNSIAATMSTTKNVNLLIGFLSVTTAFTSLTRPSGFSAIVTSASVSADYSNQSISAPITSSSKSFSWTGGAQDAGLILDAVQASGQ